jgi:glutathione S-transferase
MSYPIVRRMIDRRYGIDDASVSRAEQRIAESLERIGTLLEDGRRYLGGDRFSVADISFAALAAPVLLPPEHPIPHPKPEELPEHASAMIASFRDTRAGRFGLRLYREERFPSQGEPRR